MRGSFAWGGGDEEGKATLNRRHLTSVEGQQKHLASTPLGIRAVAYGLLELCISLASQNSGVLARYRRAGRSRGWG